MGRYVKFNQNAYVQALKKAIDTGLEKVSREVYTSLVSSLGSANLRDLDREYLGQMQASIRRANERVGSMVMSKFLAGGEGFENESFRVVYYEYGTGEKMRPPSDYSQSSDPFFNHNRGKGGRPYGASPIYQRPRGPWKDAGGNPHYSKTRGAPRPLSKKNPYAQAIEPEFWFREGFRKGTMNLDKIILASVKSVPISSYISIADIRKRV